MNDLSLFLCLLLDLQVLGRTPCISSPARFSTSSITPHTYIKILGLVLCIEINSSPFYDVYICILLILRE